MKTKTFGNICEGVVCKWLEQKGCKILARNYTVKGGELDIIAVDGDTLRAAGQREGQTGGGGIHIDAHGHGDGAGTAGSHGGPGLHLVGAIVREDRSG